MAGIGIMEILILAVVGVGVLAVITAVVVVLTKKRGDE